MGKTLCRTAQILSRLPNQNYNVRSAERRVIREWVASKSGNVSRAWIEVRSEFHDWSNLFISAAPGAVLDAEFKAHRMRA